MLQQIYSKIMISNKVYTIMLSLKIKSTLEYLKVLSRKQQPASEKNGVIVDYWAKVSGTIKITLNFPLKTLKQALNFFIPFLAFGLYFQFCIV